MECLVEPFRTGRAVFVRYFLCMAWLAVDDDGETMVVTASSVEQTLKMHPPVSASLPRKTCSENGTESEGCPQRSAWRTTDERRDNRKGVSIRGLDSSYTLILATVNALTPAMPSSATMISI